MKANNFFLAVLLAGCFGASAAGRELATPPIVPSDPEAAGREFAAQLLALRPEASVTNDALLRVYSGRTLRFEIPVQITVQAGETSWSTTYRTEGTNQEHAAAFTVTHFPDRPNEYRVAVFSRPPGDTNEFQTLTGNQAFVPFADSDYLLADLGLEFLHWPTQRLLQKELCRGQSCNKLESIAPPGQTNGYVRVVSWFDIDTGGPVLCEAYDANGKQVKEFKPTGVKKVNGEWHVEEMEISNPRISSRTRPRTVLHFILEGR
jgi:hypothetical protein